MVAIESGQWVSLAARGDEAAFAQLIMSCKNTLYAAARAILRNGADAEDCVQEAVLKGWEKLGTLKEPDYFTTWMTRIVVNTAINMSRKRARQQALPLIADVPAKGSHADEHMDIRRAIESLDPKTRICTVLYYFEDVPIAQIAAIVGLRQGTVKSRLFRAREKLRGILEGYDHDQ